MTAEALPDLTDVTPTFTAIARREAHREADIDDLVQVALYQYHRARQRAFTLKTVVEKPWVFASRVAVRAMRGYYYQQREWQDRGEPHLAPSFDDVATGFVLAAAACVDGSREQEELFVFADYFKALERECGQTACLVVRHLLMPHGDCARYILEEAAVKRKKQLVAAATGQRSSQPRGAKKRLRITHRHIREGLGMRPAQWSRTLSRIQSFTREWVAREAAL